MAYSLLTSMSLAFWFTTRTGSVKIVPPPTAPVAATPALATSATTFSVLRARVGTAPTPTGGSTDCFPWDDTCSVHWEPHQERISCRPSGSGYQSAGVGSP